MMTMKERRRAAQCIVRSHGRMYAVYNHKYNKFAPIGGKCDGKEDTFVTLKREMKEEIGKGLNIKHIKKIGVHQRETATAIVDVHLFIVDVTKDLRRMTAKEEFLDIVEIDLNYDYNENNSYSSLVDLVKRVIAYKSA